MRRQSKSQVAFLDVLFNINLVFFILLLLAIVQVNPKNRADVTLKAEYLITLSWDSESKDDIDLFARIPTGQTIFYGNRDIPLASLSRDDMGHTLDTLTLPNGKIVEVKENWEHLTIRKAIPGVYTVNIFLYTKTDDNKPTEVTVKLERLNPYRVEFVKTLLMIREEQEETAMNFTIRGGKVVDINTYFEPIARVRGPNEH